MYTNLLLFLCLVSPIFALYQYPGCDGSPNGFPLIDLEPQLVDNVTNGIKYIIPSQVNDTSLTIVVLKGSWYDIGVAYGQLLKTEINDVVPGMMNYVLNETDAWINQIKQNLPFYLKWIPNLAELDPYDALMALLDLQHDFTLKFTPQRYTDQLKGIADGSGISLKLLTNMNLIPEFLRATCSMAGVWGPASSDTKLVQLRALDWDYKSYVAKFPLAAVYFPDEEGSNAFATFGFTSMIGAISGYSTKNAICEKVWLPTSSDPLSFFGEPFAYVLRDILQFGTNLETSVGVVFNASRTCKIHAGIGSREDNSFEGLEMDFNTLNIFNDVNYTNYTAAHPQMNGIMFWDKHAQPSSDMCLGSVLQGNYGKIDAEFLYRQAAPLHETGDTQLVVYDFGNDVVYYAGSDPANEVKAYNRSMIKLNMTELLSYESFF